MPNLCRNYTIDFETVPSAPGEIPVAVIQASATFVARSSSNTAVAVPPLIPRSPAEVVLFERGKHALEARRAARESALDRVPPSSDELALVHKLFLEEGEKCLALADSSVASSIVYTESTRVSSVDVTMPQRECMYHASCRVDIALLVPMQVLFSIIDLNIHGKIFGGWLMRRAFETAFACGWRSTGLPPRFLSLSDITFVAPVEVGSLVQFEAQV